MFRSPPGLLGATVALLSTVTAAYAQENERTSGPALDLVGGIQDARLFVHLSGSKLDYRDLAVPIAAVGIEYRVDGPWDLRWGPLGRIERGYTVRGEMDDMDGDIRFTADAAGSEVGRETIGLFVSRTLGSGVALRGAIGWQRITGHLRMRDGHQVAPYELELDGLDSGYHFEWRGRWVTIEPQVGWRSSQIALAGTYISGPYTAEGCWNLRTDLQQPRSFTNHADGGGWRWALVFRHRTSAHLSLVAEVWHTNLNAEDGYDRVFHVDRGVLRGNLYEVSWTTRGLRLSLNGSF